MAAVLRLINACNRLAGTISNRTKLGSWNILILGRIVCQKGLEKGIWQVYDSAFNGIGVAVIKGIFLLGDFIITDVEQGTGTWTDP